MNTVRTTDRGARALVTRIAASGAFRVRVGVLDDAPARGEGDESPLTLVEVAAVNEFGGGDVPPRSFIRGTVDAKHGEIVELQKKLGAQILRGTVTEEVALERLGLKIVGYVQTRIAEGIDPPNAPSTIARKGSSKPLVDTGQLRSSIAHRVYREG